MCMDMYVHSWYFMAFNEFNVDCFEGISVWIWSHYPDDWIGLSSNSRAVFVIVQLFGSMPSERKGKTLFNSDFLPPFAGGTWNEMRILQRGFTRWYSATGGAGIRFSFQGLGCAVDFGASSRGIAEEFGLEFRAVAGDSVGIIFEEEYAEMLAKGKLMAMMTDMCYSCMCIPVWISSAFWGGLGPV